MKVTLGADHGGYTLKEELLPWLKEQGFEALDLGAHSFDPDDDYPDFAKVVGQALVSGIAERGIIVCGSGVGASVAASKINGIRAAVCHDTYSARQGVEHDDMNVLCLGSRVIGIELAKELVGAFLKAKFSGDERHNRRLNKVLDLED